MATRVIDDSKLNDIAVAIQAKDSGGQMTVDDMPDRIDALPTGGTLIPKTITENGIYNASSDNADGYDVVTVNVPQDPYEMLAAVMNKTATEIVSDKITLLRARLCQANTNLKRVILSSKDFSFGMANHSDNVYYLASNLVYVLYPHSKITNVTTIGSYHCESCTALKLFLFQGAGNIGTFIFLRAMALKSVIITRKDAVQPLSATNAFNDSGIAQGTGYIYIPDSLKTGYQNATNWSYYSSQIRGYQEASDYSSTNQYTVGDVCKHNNKFYAWINLTDGNSEPTNAVDTYTDWYCVADIEVI